MLWRIKYLTENPVHLTDSPEVTKKLTHRSIELLFLAMKFSYLCEWKKAVSPKYYDLTYGRKRTHDQSTFIKVIL